MYDQGMTIELRDLLPAADPVAGVAFFMGWLRRVDMLALTPEEQLALAGQIEAAKGTMAAARPRAAAGLSGVGANWPSVGATSGTVGVRRRS